MRSHPIGLSVAVLLTTSALADPITPQMPLDLHSATPWSLDIREQNPAWYESDKPPRSAPTMADALANELADRGIGFDHSAIIIGRDLGNGWHLYMGSTLKGASLNPTPGQHWHSPVSVGVEYRFKF